LASLARSTAEDGCLVLGADEAPEGLPDTFEAAPGGGGLYRRDLRRRAA
jgi:hypothetical protein